MGEAYIPPASPIGLCLIQAWKRELNFPFQDRLVRPKNSITVSKKLILFSIAGLQSKKTGFDFLPGTQFLDGMVYKKVINFG